MLDDLELQFDEDEERGRHRHRRAARRGGGRGRGADGRDVGSRDQRRRGRSLLALFLTLAILGALGLGAWYGFGKLQDFFAVPDYNSGGSGEITIEVKNGQTATDIANTLYTKGVVKSTKAFVQAAQANPRSTTIQPGFYKLRLQMRAKDALAMMIDGSARVTSKVTLAEGLTYKETLAEISKQTGIAQPDLEAAAKDPLALGIPDFWFNRTDKKQSIKSVEGFLYPDTYQFNPGATATEVLKTMVGQFLKVAQDLHITEVAQQKGVMPFEVLITASLVQGEAGVPEDLGKIARVVYNRLDKPMELQFDSCTNYWRELNGLPRKHGLSTAELTDPKNPYRTYGVAGLPPGPIGNPGKDALAAAIDPPKGNWLYFVRIDKEGHSAFTNDYNEHLRNIATARKNGL
jgi:UPF0755 protein